MRYRGRIISVSLALVAHSTFVVYYAYYNGGPHILDLIGYPFWFVVAYWIGKQRDLAVYYSEKDPLTSLYNRRFILKYFDKITALADRNQGKIFLLMIDCDNFKEINDFYGHNTGDLILENIGKLMIGTMRKSDICVCWDGDEFIVIGQLKDVGGLPAILQRLEEEFLDLSKEMRISISVSIGSAIYPDDNNNLEGLIKIADKNMYSNKFDKVNILTS